MPLENSADNFRRGKKDVFHVDAPDVGAVVRARLGHDNKGSFFGDDASWHCASLEITNTATKIRTTRNINRFPDRIKSSIRVNASFENKIFKRG